MKRIFNSHILQIVFPLGMYYILYYAWDALFLQLFGTRIGKVSCLCLAALFTLPFLYAFYRRAPVAKGDKGFDKADVPGDFTAIGCVAAAGLLLNFAAAHLPLDEISPGYASANETLTDGSMGMMILTTAVVIPVLEELLYRGILLGQMLVWAKPFVGILISALLFGIFHFNVVQFLYAFLVGLILGVAFYQRGKLWVCIVGHGLTNLLVLLISG